jgi:hypothetical protein
MPMIYFDHFGSLSLGNLSGPVRGTVIDHEDFKGRGQARGGGSQSRKGCPDKSLVIPGRDDERDRMAALRLSLKVHRDPNHQPHT